MSVAPGFLRTQSDLFDIPIAPPASQRIDPGTAATTTHRVVADTWNRYGGLLGGLSERLETDPTVAVAVLAIEAGGRAFSADGRMIIRFENHIFFDQWGCKHRDAFARTSGSSLTQPGAGKSTSGGQRRMHRGGSSTAASGASGRSSTSHAG